MEQPLVVQAEYSFKGGNNDELCFKKGDLITVTQREDGGWWEGTLNDKTGWFPSNYVNEYKAPLPLTETIRPPEEILEYRSVVLADLLDSERAHVAEIQGLLENFLEPLQQAQILNQDEYAQLMCNFLEVVKTHNELLSQMEECNDRVGKLFLNKAPLMKQIHQAYCAAHPKAIVILDKYKDELEKYMERQGAATPGLLVLTTGLSKPFRRLDKYSAMLQELERHMESSHPDRGDTQRSVAVYKDIAAICSATRRQKELELQVLTGPVRGWQGQELSSLGDIIHMGSVAVGADHHDRYFVLFPQTLLILSVSQRMSAFIYEGKLPLTGIVVNRLDDSDNFKNAFEISGPLIERIVAICQGPNEANKWVELLATANPSSMPIGIKRQLSNLSNSSMGGSGGGGGAPQPPAHKSHILDVRGYCTRFSLCAYYNTPPSTPYCITLPPSNYPPTAPYAKLSAHFARHVKAGRLRTEIIKMLLYPQARQSIDMKRIPMRKKHRRHSSKAATAKLLKKARTEELIADIASDSFERSELGRQDAFELPTDSESDEYEEIGGDCDSNPFEYIKFYANKRDSIYDSTGTFVDYGSAAERKARHCSSINLIKLDSDSVEDIKTPQTIQKESLIIGSKAMRALARKSTQQSIVIHTSTAHLDLSGGGGITSCVEEEKEGGVPQVIPIGSFQTQNSENSVGSSVYLGRYGGAYVACENLANMSDETKIKVATTTPPLAESPPERHSMPNIFVGNRFNRCSNTKVYVPSWKDRNDMQNQSIDTLQHAVLTEEKELNDDEMHSSSLDLPASCRTAPDKLQAELLYNFDGRCSTLSDLDIISPPSMFKQPVSLEEAARRVSLQRESAPFKKHALNSDKRLAPRKDSKPHDKNRSAEATTPARGGGLRYSSTTELCIEPQRSSGGSDGQQQDRPNSIRRCISYQYVQMSNSADSDSSIPATTQQSRPFDIKANNDTLAASTNIPSAERNRRPPFRSDNAPSAKCKCCESSQCPSPRSSDSGMAGSCTIASPDPPNPDTTYDGYYQGGGLQLSTPSTAGENNNDLTRFDVCGTFREQFLTPEATQDLMDGGDACGSSDAQSRTPPNHSSAANASATVTTTAELQINTKSIFINSKGSCQPSSSSGDTPTSDDAAANILFSSSPGDAEMQTTSARMFRSGMYAHWWKKEKLPADVVRGIATANNKSLQSPQTSKDSYCSVCSSCLCFMGASGFSEGTQYSSLCHDCASFCRAASPTTNTTNTTTTTPSRNCPICNASAGTRGTHSFNEVHKANTITTSSSKSSSSSFECPICSGLLARSESLGSEGIGVSNNDDAANDAAAEDVTASKSGHAGTTHKSSSSNFEHSGSGSNVDVASVTTQTEPIVQSSSQLQSIHAHSASTTTTASSSSATTATKSTKSSGGATKPQIKFSPDIEQYFKDPTNHGGKYGNSSGSGGKRKDRKHKSISNLRPAPPLRPTLLNSNVNSGGGGGGSGAAGSSSNALSSYCSGRKNQPTFEEDALVLRVFEAYCAAYQNNARNTIHSALQPWTPCLPIRGGKLKTSKPFSTSNPQLPFLCNTGHGGASFPGAIGVNNQQNSSSSLNSSYIWREASPNNFNLYSTSVSSLNAGGAGAASIGYRYSLTGSTAPAMAAGHAASATGSILDYQRALSEERATRKSLNRFKSGFGSGYDNIFMTPLLPRKNKPSPKLIKTSAVYQSHQRSPPTRNRSEEHPPATPPPLTKTSKHKAAAEQYPAHPGLYDRRLNRSFETASHRYAGYGGGYMMGYGGLKTNVMRRSTPHLAADDEVDDVAHDSSDDADRSHRGCGVGLLGNGSSGGGAHAGGGNCTAAGSDGSDSQRHSGSWCCGLENEDMTPTLRQLWTAIRQMQQDMSQMKLQINEERALRVNLQQLLMQHLEGGSSITSNTPKC